VNIKAAMAVLQLEEPDHFVKFSLLAIACRAQPGEPAAFVSRRRLADDLSVSYWTMARAIQRAKSMGYVEELREYIGRRPRVTLRLTQRTFASNANGSRAFTSETSTNGASIDTEGQEKDVAALLVAAVHGVEGAHGTGAPPPSWAELRGRLPGSRT
jgi:DNA-binding MarR family transcriptional regulator